MSTAQIFAPEGLQLTKAERAFFAQSQPWGFILFARNIETPDQLRALTADLRDSVGRDAPILIDQEGGRVQRMRAPQWREYLPALDQVLQAGAQAPRSMWVRARLIAAELWDVGIDVNCAPLADVARAQTHPIVRNRLYGSDPDTVVQNAQATADGFLAGGVLPVLKHLPGYGLAQVDSHLDLPRVDAARDVLDAIDFAAFRPLADMPLGMTAHILMTAVDGQNAATLSPAMIQLIREEIGFQGLLMTDDISMEALPGSLAERVRGAHAAGCDLILHCNGRLPEMEIVAGETPTLTPEAEARGAAALAMRKPPEPLDIGALEAELADLLAGQADGTGTAATGK